MAVLCDRSQTSNPSPSPPQPTAIRYFLRPRLQQSVLACPLRACVQQSFVRFLFDKSRNTKHFPCRSSSVFILSFVRSITRWFFFSFDPCNTSLVIRLITLRNLSFIILFKCTSYKERVSALTEKRPDRKPANTTVPVYILTEETTIRHHCLLRV